MAAAHPPTPSLFDLRSASITLTALVLKNAELSRLAAELKRRYGAGGLFEDEPLLVDVTALGETTVPDFAGLLPLLRSHGLRAIAMRGGGPGHATAAMAAGLIVLPEVVSGGPAAPEPRPAVQPSAQVSPAPAAEAPRGAAVERAAPPAPAPQGQPTLVIDRPLRSGQQVYARGGDLIVMAPVSFGAEVIADGHIHVYAPLRGRAIAGARGDTSARIFSTAMEPQLVAIAGTYRTIESALPAEVGGKPAQVRLDGERIVIEPITT